MKTPKFTYIVTFVNENGETVEEICKKWKGYDFNVFNWAEEIVKESNGKFSDFFAYTPYSHSCQK